LRIPFFFKKGKGEHGSSRITGDSPGREGNSLLGGLRKKGRGEGNAEPRVKPHYLGESMALEVVRALYPTLLSMWITTMQS
jgi:hypothetical protein